MTDQDEYGKKLTHFTNLIRHLLDQKPGNYTADPVDSPGHLYEWKLYRKDEIAVVQLLAPGRFQLLVHYDKPLEQQLAFLVPSIDGAIAALESKM